MAATSSGAPDSARWPAPAMTVPTARRSMRPAAAAVLPADKTATSSSRCGGCDRQAAVPEGHTEAGRGDVAQIAGRRCSSGPRSAKRSVNASGTPFANRWDIRAATGTA